MLSLKLLMQTIKRFWNDENKGRPFQIWQKWNPEATLALGAVCSYKSAISLMVKSRSSQRGNSKHFSLTFPFFYNKGTHILQRRLNTLFYLLLFWSFSSNIIGLESGTCHFQEVGSKWDFSFQFWQHTGYLWHFWPAFQRSQGIFLLFVSLALKFHIQQVYLK